MMRLLYSLFYTFLVSICHATTPLTDPAYSTIAPTESVVYTPPPLPTLTTSPYVLQSRPTSEFYPTDFSLINLFDNRSDVSYDNLVLMYALWTDYTRLAPSFFSRWRTELNLIYSEMGISGDVVSKNLAFISRIQHGSTGNVIGTVVRSAPDYICAYPSPTTTEQYTLDQPETSIDTAPKLTNSFGVSTVTAEFFFTRSEIVSERSALYDQFPTSASLRVQFSSWVSRDYSFYSRYLSEFNSIALAGGEVSPDIMSEVRSYVSNIVDAYVELYSSDDFLTESSSGSFSNYSAGSAGPSPSPSDARSSSGFASSSSRSKHSAATSISSKSSSVSASGPSSDASSDASSKSSGNSILSESSDRSTVVGGSSSSSLGENSDGSVTLGGSSGGSSGESSSDVSSSSTAVADSTRPYLVLGAVLGGLPFLMF